MDICTIIKTMKQRGFVKRAIGIGDEGIQTILFLVQMLVMIAVWHVL